MIDQMHKVDTYDAPGRAGQPKPRVTDVTDLRTRPSAPVTQQTAFYELDKYAKYNDPLMVAGFLVVVAGVALMHVPIAVVLLGGGMMKLAWMMGGGK